MPAGKGSWHRSIVVVLIVVVGAVVVLWVTSLPSQSHELLVPSYDVLAMEPNHSVDWLTCYIRWHRTPDTESTKYLVWDVSNGDTGGIGDRMRGLVSAFYLALVLGRKFRIHCSHPVALTTVLLPADIDWASNAATIAARASVTLYWVNGVNNDELSDTGAGRYDQVQALRIVTNMPFWSAIMNGDPFAERLRLRNIPSGVWTIGKQELLFTWAWNALMRPSAALLDDLNALRRRHQLQHDFVAVHIRRGGHWGDGIRHSNVQAFVDCAINVTKVMGTTVPVYVASDDAETRDEFSQRCPFPVRYDDSEPFHVAASPESDPGRHLRAWAELYLFMEAMCVVSSRSGFSEWPVVASRDSISGVRCHARFDHCGQETILRSRRELVPLPLWNDWHPPGSLYTLSDT